METRSDKIRRLFLEAVQTPAQQRPQFVESIGRDDPDLAKQIESLLSCIKTELVQLDRDSAANDPLIGLSAGRWHLRRAIGKGGMGRVYLGIDESGQKAAVKILDRLELTSTAQKRFRAEIEALRMLEHPGIVRLIDWGEAILGNRQIPYLATEFVSGAEPIIDYALASVPHLDGRCRMLEVVCNAVAHAHEQGIVHRDLKQENILVGKDGAPKVIDFGIARLAATDHPSLQGMTAEHGVLGSLTSMAPEQCDQSKGPIGPATDVYALGTVLYQLLCGESPYATTGSIAAAMQAVLHVPPTDPRAMNADISEPIAAVLLHALAKDPAKRPANAAVLAWELKEARAGRRAAPSLPQPPKSPSLPVPRVHQTVRTASWGLKILAAVVGVALLCMVLYLLFFFLLPTGKRDTAREMTAELHPLEQEKKDMPKQLTTAAALALGTAISASADINTIEEWGVSIGGNGHWYELQIVEDGVNWHQAMAIAQSKGGYLVTLHSDGENEFVRALYSVNPEASIGNWGPWIGANANGEEWRWPSSNEEWDYEAWAPGEPGSDGDDKAAGYWNDAGGAAAWADHFETTLLSALVIEYETVPSHLKRVPQDYSSIQQAIDSCVDGDQVKLSAGTYYEQINFKGKEILVYGDAPAYQVLIDGEGTGPVVQFVSGESDESILRQVTIIHGASGGSGCSSYGGAIHASDSSPTLVDCRFVENQSVGGGGCVHSTKGATPLLINCEFSNTTGNSVVSDICDGASRLFGCRFMNNQVTHQYHHSLGGHNILGDCTFSGCKTPEGGAVLYWDQAQTSGLVEGCMFDEVQYLSDEEVFYHGSESVTFSGCTFHCIEPSQFEGPWNDAGENVFDQTGCSCTGDVDRDGRVDGSDLSYILAGWGPASEEFSQFDIDGNGIVNGADLAIVLALWGVCGG